MLNLLAYDNYLTEIEVQGYSVIHQAIDERLISDLMADCYRINPHFTLAGIGRLNNLQVDDSIRKDKTYWFDGTSQAQVAYQAIMENIKTTLNRTFFYRLI